AGQAGPAVEARSAVGVAVGNRFTVSDGVALKAGSIELDNSRIGRPDTPAPPPAIAFPAIFRGSVATVQAGSGAAAIQAALDTAARRGGGVVYLAPGSHPVDRTIVLPGNTEVKLIGDGLTASARLEWTGPGSGPVVRLAGAGHGQLRDLGVTGAGRADGIEFAGADAGRGLVLDQLKVSTNQGVGFQAERLGRAIVVLRDMDHSGNGVGIRVLGRGAGPSAPLMIASGSSSNNETSYELGAGGRLVARDIWYESGAKPGFMRLTGEADFTLNGSNIATPRQAEAPPVLVQDLKGRATFLGVIFSGAPETLPAIVAAGAEPAQALLLLGCQGNGEFFADRSRAGRAVRRASYTYANGGGARPLPDRGGADSGFLRQMLAGARTQEPRDLGPPRLARLYVDHCRVGVRVTP
ncbi:MAG TPA: hypothetical protein VFN88_07555, partial [Caulobacteraceae bacterium]|nr:hypothetical protein [Caulobacteraceae bacterium]